ncbi:MAG: hypothetical protein U0Q18_17340 [Bryobacteraceae bacterium]
MRRPVLTFADVGGLEDAETNLVVQANLEEERSGNTAYIATESCSHGPRGTGKTFLAKQWPESSG